MNKGLALGKSLRPLLVQKAQRVATEMTCTLNQMKALRSSLKKKALRRVCPSSLGAQMQNEPELRNTGPSTCPLEVGGQ